MFDTTTDPTQESPVPEFPQCCYADEDDELAIHLYATYNRGGDPATAGLNYAGQECPAWDALPDNVKAKWRAVAEVHPWALVVPDPVPPRDILQRFLDAERRIQARRRYLFDKEYPTHGTFDDMGGKEDIVPDSGMTSVPNRAVMKRTFPRFVVTKGDELIPVQDLLSRFEQEAFQGIRRSIDTQVETLCMNENPPSPDGISGWFGEFTSIPGGKVVSVVRVPLEPIVLEDSE